MARARTNPFWIHRIRRHTANAPRLGPGPITHQLEQDAASLSGDNPRRLDPPSERTVAREMKRFRDEDEETQRLYREVHWPESFENGSIPWEAGALALDLIGVEQRGRPLVRNVLWAWRITLAHPQAPIEERWRAACYMAAWEVDPDRNKSIPQGVEAWLHDAGTLDDLHIDGTGALDAIEALSGAPFTASLDAPLANAFVAPATKSTAGKRTSKKGATR